MADNKAELKSARDAIANKDYKQAQQFCKNILRADKHNYMALVFLGVALEGSEQAVFAFQKAISVDKQKVLAWQGLANYYEKKDGQEDLLKLFKVYEELIKFEKDELKLSELITKLSALGKKLCDSINTIHILNEFMSNAHSSTLKHDIKECILDLLRGDITKESNTSSLLELYVDFIESKNVTADQSLLLNYAKVLFMNRKQSNDTMKTILQLCEKYKNIELVEWFCLLIANDDVLLNTLPKYDLLSFVKEVVMDKANFGVKLLSAMLELELGNAMQAYETAINIYSNSRSSDVTLLLLIIKCCQKLGKWSEMVTYCAKVLNVSDDSNALCNSQKALILSFSYQGKSEEAVNLSETISIDDLSLEHLAALTMSVIDVDISKSDIYLEKLENTEWFAPLNAIRLVKEGKLVDAEELLLNTVCNNYLKWINLGIIYWKSEKYELSLMPLLKAAKIQPYNHIPFLYLGHYYGTFLNDLEKAKKCYIKAYNLNYWHSESIKSLSIIYRQLGDWNANYELLTNVSAKLSGEWWPKLHIGLHHLSLRQWDEAITNLRSVISTCSGNVEAWESLADAYYSRGSYISALKCYKKVMEMSSGSRIYPQTQIGAIHYALGQYNEALHTYREVLIKDSSSIIVLKGMAETWLGISEQKFEVHLYGLSRDSAQKSVDYITEALQLDNSYSCLWQILANGLLLITHLPKDDSYAYIREFLINGKNKTLIYKCAPELYPLMIAYYCRAINVSPSSNPALYRDLAIAYFEYYRFTKDLHHCRRAYTAAYHCVKLDRDNSQFWNFLGVICVVDECRKYSLAQHCFMKAISCDENNSNAWTNLGLLYLKLKNMKLANSYFKRAQQSNPSNIQSWIGQSIIAEHYAEDEAMDLFRHALVLGHHRESSFGYADWVCRMLQTTNIKDFKYKYAIENMHAVPMALDSITRLCKYEYSNSCIYTIQGILQEKSGLFRSALVSFQQALKYTSAANEDICKMNLGKLLLHFKKWEEAIEQFKAVKEASLDSACGIALSLYKTSNYEEAYSTYETALSWLASDDGDKALLLVAMAGVIYNIQGINDAKTLLFQSIKVLVNKPCPQSLLSACALGLIHSDRVLSNVALSILERYKTDVKYSYDIGFLQSYMVIKQGELLGGLRMLSKSIHNTPSLANLWLCMANYCLQDHQRTAIASICSQKALTLQQGNLNLSSLARTASLAELLLGNTAKSLTLVQKAIHSDPDQTENWVVLIAILLPSLQQTNLLKWIKKLFTYVQHQENLSTPIKKWITSNKKILEMVS